MTPRREMFVIDLEEGDERARQRIIETEFSRLIVCRDGLDHILGVLQTGDLLKKALPGHCITGADIESVLHPPLYVPETVTTTQLLENFRRARLQFALIVDEYGDVQGLVTLTDVMSAIVGELSEPEAPEDATCSSARTARGWSMAMWVSNDSSRYSTSRKTCPGRMNAASTPWAVSSCTPGAHSGSDRSFRSGRMALRSHGHGQEPGRQGAAVGDGAARAGQFLNARNNQRSEFQRIDLDVPAQLGRCLEARDGLPPLRQEGLQGGARRRFGQQLAALQVGQAGHAHRHRIVDQHVGVLGHLGSAAAAFRKAMASAICGASARSMAWKA
jgi:hypothetical protein